MDSVHPSCLTRGSQTIICDIEMDNKAQLRQKLLRHRRSSSSDSVFDSNVRLSCSSTNICNHRRHSASIGNDDVLLQNIITFCDSNPQLPQKVFLHLIDYIYSNVFEKVQKRIKRALVTELWELLPNEATEDWSDSVNWFSKQELCEAFIDVEKRFSGICALALHTIANYKQEPFIIDVVIQFIEHHYQEIIHVSKAVHRLLPKHLNKNTTEYRNDHCTRRYILERRESPTLRRLRLRKRFVITLIISLAVTSVSCYGTTIFYNRNTNEQNMSYPEKFHRHNESMMEMMSMEPVNIVVVKKTEEQKIPPRYFLTVNSYDEYKNAMLRLMHDREISLVVSLEDDSNWPLFFPEGNTHMIKELQIVAGASIAKVLNILGAMKNVELVTIKNQNDLLCQDFHQHEIPSSNFIVLSELRDFRLEEFKECHEFYKIISDTLVLKKMQSFQAFSSNFTNRNIKFVRKLLSNSREYLQSLEFPGCKWYDILFDKNFGTYQSVTYLRFDVQGAENIIHFNKNIHNMLPSLQKFESLSGFVGLAEILNLAGCTKLTEITVGLQTNNPTGTLDIMPLQKHFIRFKVLELSFNFIGFDGAFGCILVGLQELKQMVVGFEYRSNCHIRKENH